MKLVVLVLLALCALAHGRQLKQTTVAQALQAAQGTRVSTLLAAVQAAGLTIPNDAAWTILAPTNEAFNNDDIREQTGLTAAQLLEPANKVALTQLLSYHVVPSGAVRAAQLSDGQQLPTLLEGAAPLRVDKDDDGVEIEVPGQDDDDSADVVVADIVAGNSVVHIIDEVLIPASLRRTSGAAAAPATGRRLQDDDGDDDDGKDDDGNPEPCNSNSNSNDDGDDDKYDDGDDDDNGDDDKKKL